MTFFMKHSSDVFNKVKERICIIDRIKPWDMASCPKDHEYIKTPYDHLLIFSFFNGDITLKNHKTKLAEIISNTFYPEHIRTIVQNVFWKIKKHVSVLTRFIYKYRLKKYMIFDNDYDLCMNDLSLYREHTLLTIVENKVKYRFRITDLMKIIHNALTHNYELFAEPLDIKNPYTNSPISQHNLYNIYYAVKYSHYTMPVLFHLYFKSNFDIDRFILDYEPQIREESITSLFKNLSGSLLTANIKDMFQRYKKYFVLHIDEGFPSDKLNEIFYPFIEPFLISKFSSNRVRYTHYTNLLRNKLIQFCENAPTFGRRIVKLKEGKGHTTYIFDHVPYKNLVVDHTRCSYFNDQYDSGSDDNEDEDEDEDEENTIELAEQNNIDISNQRIDLIITEGIHIRTLYDFNINALIENTEENIIIDTSDNESDDELEEELRPFPYNYDSH